MSKERKSGFGKFLLGAGIGVGLGILFAPKSEDVKATIEAKVQEIKEDLKNLDKETVAAAVKSGAAKIKRKADELVEFAVLKGTPVIEAAAREVKNSTIKTLEGITAKLKDEEPKKQETKPQNKKKSQTSK